MQSTILRIYMKASAKVKDAHLSFWQRIFNGLLGSYLLRKAKDFGLQQALLQKLSAGYLNGNRLIFDVSEVAPPDLPLCLEIIDTESNLQKFIQKNKKHLSECRVVIFQAAEWVN